MSQTRPERMGLRAAPAVLWVATLGAAVAWSAHVLVDWGVDETVCRSGHDQVLGVPLRVVVGVLAVLFLVACVVCTVAAWRLQRRLSTEPAADDRARLRQDRAALMARLGLVGGLLFTLMTLMGAVSVLLFPACRS